MRRAPTSIVISSTAPFAKRKKRLNRFDRFGERIFEFCKTLYTRARNP
jgi:hypothetical protein